MKTFGLLGIFRRLLLLIFLSLANVGKADETTVMMSREVNTRQSGFAYFIKEKFSHLNITALVKRVTEKSLSCAFSCLNNLACFSFNLAAFPDEAGKFSCEILSSDKYKNSKDFLPSKNFHHFSIVVSNLALDFVLIFVQPECLIKRQKQQVSYTQLNVYGKRS
ncbi:uncharacterized protein LOC122962249 [Acropora millepora]|uniref:uncharacterized protein LOC122962249 n=1 Tax=Acropora millepora TaxID=45264 RepID=UPI001CF3D916|nr:uncharacterized protein LOC122962249 [Acropora millepora]